MTAENTRTPISCRVWAAPEDRRPPKVQRRALCRDSIGRGHAASASSARTATHLHQISLRIPNETVFLPISAVTRRNGTHPLRDRAQFTP